MSKLSLVLSGAKEFMKAPIANPTTGKAILAVRRNAPEILVYSGVVGMVASTVVACSRIFESQNTHVVASVERIRMKSFVEENPDSAEAKTFKRDLTTSYLKEARDHAKIMAPALTLGAISITAILTGHNMLRKRHVVLGASFLALQEEYREYRDAVKESIGEETELEIRNNLLKERAGDTASSEFLNSHSVYTKLFDATNVNWNDDNSYNIFFLRNVQNIMNDKLRVNGYVFLNDVYKALGFPATRAGQQVGWVNGSKTGDSFIDFGIYDEKNDRAKDFINGYENSIWLDFNVDGDILNSVALADF